MIRLTTLSIVGVLALHLPVHAGTPIPIDPAGGIFVRAEQAANPRYRDTFIYEAALSGRFGAVESEEEVDRWVNGSPSQPKSVIVSWVRVDNFARCAKLGTHPGGLVTSDLNVRPFDSDQNLVRGTCVIGKVAETVRAKWEIGSPNSDPTIKNRSTGQMVKTLPAIGGGEWSNFGLARFNSTNWTDDENARRADQATDHDLVKALGSKSDAMRQAALRVLADRVISTSRPQKFSVSEIQRTDRSVGIALAQSGLLAAHDRNVLRTALEAAAAIPSASDVLTPKLLEALATPLKPKDDAFEQRILKERLGWLPGSAGLFSNSENEFGADDWQVVNAAGLAASRLGPLAVGAVTRTLDKRLDGFLHRGFDRNDVGGLVLLAAKSNRARDLAISLMSAPQPATIGVGCEIAQHIDDPKRRLLEIAATRCNQPLTSF